jgi:hypothetical protein
MFAFLYRVCFDFDKHFQWQLSIVSWVVISSPYFCMVVDIVELIYKPYRTSLTISTDHTEQVQQYLQTIKNKFNNIYKPYVLYGL